MRLIQLRRRRRVPWRVKLRLPRKRMKLRIPKIYIALAMLLLVLGVFAYSFYRFDRIVVPLVLEAEDLRMQAEINNVINAVIQEIVREQRIIASDFYHQRHDVVPGAPVLSVNTVLVNDLCNLAAKRISERLNNMEPEVISVPLGMALGLDTLAQMGPQFRFTMAPIGNALVSYDSRFVSVGINQVHFSVWLTVEAVVRIINPVHSFEVTVDRHISLVDTVISGVVPETYLHMDIPRGLMP
ncbi:MAG: sporulation protein YunB [Defluviitaleaceae bacterium]|nr:sporulation protein YunB [Defluviitaleaceae bacterium]MCL2275662.1 sporulation protein YunB [Defluviitaleaceae bacterium]